MTTEAQAVDRGNIFWRLSKKFQFAADRLIPDSFVFCVILAFITFIVAMIATGTGPMQMITYWYDGFWTQSIFAFQMTILVVVCAAFAQAPIIRKGLDKLAGLASTPRGCMVVLMVFGYVASFINWAFCTIVCPILAMRMAKRCKGLHFPMMLAGGYSTMILGQCMGPSASVYALLAGEHDLQDQIGILSQDLTTYNPMNVTLWIILAVVTIFLAIMTTPPASEIIEFHATIADNDIVEEKTEEKTIAEKMNSSRILMYLVAVIGLVYVVWSFVTVGILASLSLNFVIFLFITLNCIAYNSPKKFIAAIRNSMYLATDVMIQFPFYGAIMGMMTSSGLGQMIIDGLSSMASATTVPLITYIFRLYPEPVHPISGRTVDRTGHHHGSSGIGTRRLYSRHGQRLRIRRRSHQPAAAAVSDSGTGHRKCSSEKSLGLLRVPVRILVRHHVHRPAGTAWPVQRRLIRRGPEPWPAVNTVTYGRKEACHELGSRIHVLSLSQLRTEIQIRP